MSQLNLVKNASNPDQIYFDLLTTNFQSTTSKPSSFYYQEQRTMPFILCPEEYYLSIYRFTIDTGTAPISIVSIQPNQADRDLTIYSVTLQWTDLTIPRTYTQQTYIRWIPQDKSATVPLAPSQTLNGLQSNETGYYNLYSYSYFCYRIYVAFQECLADLLVQIAAGGSPSPFGLDTPHAPLIGWDSTSSQGVLYAENTIYELNVPIPNPTNYQPINIYMNAPLYTLFSSFPSLYLGYENVLNGKNFQLTLVDFGGINYQSIVNPLDANDTYNAIVLYQEFPTTEAWSAITAIVFCSNTLPINPSNVSSPQVFNENQIVGVQGNNSSVSNIITDITSDSGLFKPSLTYVPTQYRYTTLYGNQPLNSFDLSIFYRLRTGQLIPFTLNSGGSVTMKLAFIKKDLVKS
jgi:hypothetical protein